MAGNHPLGRYLEPAAAAEGVVRGEPRERGVEGLHLAVGRKSDLCTALCISFVIMYRNYTEVHENDFTAYGRPLSGARRRGGRRP